MVTAQQVYNMALVYIDEVTDTGLVVADNPNYYRTKALSILTALQVEVGGEPTVFNDLSQEVGVSERVALLVLPYGLAAHLLLQEDMTSAAYFNNRYDELKSKLKTDPKPIEDKYDVLGGMQ